MEVRASGRSNARESPATQPTWPLQFHLKLPKSNQQGAAGHPPAKAGLTKQIWWSYDLYRGPRNQNPKILYARSKAESEEIARGFLQEDVLGFDMEWPLFDGNSRNEDRLQDKIGVIAIACETKIALLHLGAYTGKEPEDLIGPVLQTIIESPRIKKAGVNILTADFGRLRDWFKLKPQAAAELSHLHSLVNYMRNGQSSQCTTKLCALDKLVQTHLGLPLKKNSVRTSNWNQKKQLSREQKAYAASDAYAGFMLYHRLNFLRLSVELSPPPPPLYAERYKWLEIPRRGTALLLELDTPSEEGTLKVITVKDYFDGRHDNTHTVTIASSMTPTPYNAELEGSQASSFTPTPKKTARPPPLRTSQRIGSKHRKSTSSRKVGDPLLQKLKVHRGKIAKQRRLDTWKIIHNSALELIAQLKPENEMALMGIKGVGPQTVKKYGAAILNIVALHVADDKRSTSAEDSDQESERNANGSNVSLTSEGHTNSTKTAQVVSRICETSLPHADPTSSYAAQGQRADRGGPSQPVYIDDQDDMASPEVRSAKTMKRKTRQTVSIQHTISGKLLKYFILKPYGTNNSNLLLAQGPRHGLLRYFEVGKRQKTNVPKL